jgi:hypothetical protein
MSRRLREIPVETDDHTHHAERRLLERGEAVAGAKHGGFERGRVEVGQAVPGHEIATGVEHEGRVVEVAPLVHLGHAAGDEPEVGGTRRGRQPFAAGAVTRLGGLAGVIGQGERVVAARPQFGQDEQLDAACGRQVDHVECDLQVALGLPGHGQPLRYPNLEISLHIRSRPAAQGLPVDSRTHGRTGPF